MAKLEFPVATELGPMVLYTVVIISFIGIVLNIVLLWLLRGMKNKDSLSFHLIQTIAIVDLLNTISYIIIFGSRGVVGPSLHNSLAFCRLSHLAWIALTGQSNLLVLTLALERYMVICKRTGLPKKYTFIVLSILSLGYLVPHLGNALTATHFYPDPTTSYCIPFGSKWATFATYTTRFLLLIPLPIIIFSYISIILASQRRCESKRGYHLIWIRAMTFLIFYSLTYLPSFVMYIWIFFIPTAYPKFLFALVPISISCVATFNPSLVLALHRPLIKKVNSLLRYQTQSSSIS